MLDRRQNVRDKVLYGGVAEIGERGATMDCVVRNISEQGACVDSIRPPSCPSRST